MRRAITYWGAKKRLDLLTAFRQRVIDYFEAAHWDPHTNDWEDSEDWAGDEAAPELRQQINEEMRDVSIALHFVGISTTIDYAPPAATGGVAGRIELLDNIFNLPLLRVPHTQLIDNLDRAIGIYRGWLHSLWRQVFNPFYWMGWGLTLIAEVPFRILDAAGFNTAKIEGSIWGKIVKAVIQFVAATGTALGVLEKLDLLKPVVSAVHRLVRM